MAPVEPTSRSRISSTHHRTFFPKRHEQPQAPCLDDNHGMKFDNAWNQGVWYALRSATGRPSPQPFSVENLPALGEKCRRIMKITSAVYTSKRRYQKSGSQARSY
ncbi:Putative cytoplasmic protein [Salmonella enterica subsp. enterica serovar Senftenberg str. A4-543]|uniref:Putative cytoplasmic protein n=1 Tax=Salmonella enterica subsp. enterica serovar Senftenberg str. A4-543 TaxID=913082 RepID=G5QYS5_SALSE|nr:Putative cytoplasmic protein [Salmonella enterica subsp. enterica serovar Senftenberg str. A4-543]